MPRSAFTDAHQTFIGMLRRARTGAGVSQKELARRIGKPQQFVSYIERGVRRVDVLEFYAIMRALSIDPGDAYMSLVKALPDDISI